MEHGLARQPVLWHANGALTPADTAAALGSGSAARPPLPQPRATATGQGAAARRGRSPFEAASQPSKGRGGRSTRAPTRSHDRYLQSSRTPFMQTLAAIVHQDLAHISPLSRLYLASISPVSRLYLASISPLSRIYLAYISHISPLYLPISPCREW